MVDNVRTFSLRMLAHHDRAWATVQREIRAFVKASGDGLGDGLGDFDFHGLITELQDFDNSLFRTLIAARPHLQRAQLQLNEAFHI